MEEIKESFKLFYEHEWNNFQKTHNYCDNCGIVFAKDEADGCCPFCILDENLSWDEQCLIVFQKRRNKLNRQIALLKVKGLLKNEHKTLKKATLNK